MKARIAKKIARPVVGKRYTEGQRDRALRTLGACLRRGRPRWATDATGPRYGQHAARMRKAVKRSAARRGEEAPK